MTVAAYTVQNGDCLSVIAARHGLKSWQQLYDDNRTVVGGDPNLILPGEKLTIRSGGAVAVITGVKRPSSSHPTSSSVGPQAADDDDSAVKTPTTTRHTPSHSSSSSTGTSAGAPSGGSYAGLGSLVAEARRLLGIPYVAGGSSPATGFDCSGFVQYALRQIGIHAPRTTYEQYAWTSRVSHSQLQPGDLVFSSWYGEAAHGHVAIYIGGGMMIEASHSGTPVRVEALNGFYLAHVDGYGRVPGLGAAVRSYVTAHTAAPRSAARQPSYRTSSTHTITSAVPGVWQRVAECESSGNWSIADGNGFYGGLQFTESTWLAYGGGAYARSANLATAAEQVAVAERVLASQGVGAWPVCGPRAGL
jgi:cell wall-associated NlpC family hydrolase